MNQTKRTQQIKPPPQNNNTNTNRRPKRCLVCRKMFAFQKFNQHYEMCTKQQQKRIDEARLKQRNARNSTTYKQIQMPTRKKQVQQKNLRQGTQQGNRFRIKSIMNEGQKSQYKSKSVLVNNNKMNEIKIQGNRPKVQENKIQPQIKVERNREEVLMANESTQSVNIPQQPFRQQPQNNFRAQVIPDNNQPAIVERDQISPIRNISQTNNRRTQQEHDHSHEQLQTNRQTLIEARIQQVPVRQQQGGYNIQALINNSNSIIQFIRGINILGQDQTMNTMLSQLQQLNLIAQQIVQISALGHALGSTMGNVFAARIHQLQTVITNQIGIALIRGFNERLGAQFQGLIQMRPQRKEGFTEAQIQELFPQRVNFNRKECSICLEDMKPSDLIIELQCYHLFHPSCIKEWLISSKKCPMCRKVQQQVS